MAGRTSLNGVLIPLISTGIVAVICTPAFLAAPAPTSNGSRNHVVLTNLELVGRSAAGKAPSKVKPASGSWRKASSDVDSNGLGFLARTTVAAVCAFVASAANRRKQQQRTSSVAMRWYPSACGEPRQKVLRRLDRYGGIPAWSRKPLLKRRLVRPWRKRTTPRLSEWGHCKYETQRVRFHYNIKNKQMEGYMRKAFTRGVGDPMETFMKQLESRMDNTVWRLGLAPTMPAARHFVREGHMQYRRDYDPEMKRRSKWRTISIPSMRLRVGDHIRVKPRKSSYGVVDKVMEEDGPVVKPGHLEWDVDKKKGRYLDTCDVNELGLKVSEDEIYRMYTGTRGLRKKHFRYFEGSNEVIPVAYNGGRIRPTPENIINMKRGKGLYKQGRRCPPSLWGRRGKTPLNNPWETGKLVRA